MVSLAIIRTRAQTGVEAPQVHVEVHLSGGLPRFSIVGMAELAVRESRDRVRAALMSCGYEFPQRRITVNLAPADLPKEGGRFDLPIAVGILAATQQLAPQRLNDSEFYGELSLRGDLRGFDGALAVALQARHGGRSLIMPSPNAIEAAMVRGVESLGAQSLAQVCAHLDGREPLTPAQAPDIGLPPPVPDLADVRGHAHPRRALEIAAAGGHSLLMSGPPGSGKSMLASRLPGLLPPLSEAQALEAAAVHSIAGQPLHAANWRVRPFRAPHHSTSAVAVVGGGSKPRPGEISLAHQGVLFLDELPEFRRDVLESLREPLESGQVMIARANGRLTLPAQFQLVAAMNPCPCGYYGEERCRCTPRMRQRYTGKLSGPLLDRIDLKVHVPAPAASLLAGPATGEGTAAVAERVCAARRRQYAREPGCVNAQLSAAQLEQVVCLSPRALTLLARAADRFALSARAFHRIQKVALSIADLEEDDVDCLRQSHVSEALSLRQVEPGQGAGVRS